MKQLGNSNPQGEIAQWIFTLALVSVAVWAIYSRGIGAPFVFDDHPTIVDNPSITNLWPLWGPDGTSSLRPPRDVSTSGRPVANLSFAMNYRAGGYDPRGYHFVNIVVHISTAMLLFALVRRTLMLPYFNGCFAEAAGAIAAATALVWAVHPLAVDAVEYITQRTELIVGFCYLATLYASLRYFTASSYFGRAAWLAIAAFVCFAGVASKEVMVTAPVVILLFERTFLAGSFGCALRNSWRLYLALFASWILLIALNINGPRAASAGFHLGISVPMWWAAQTRVLFMYLKLVVWPTPLVIHYQLPHFDSIAHVVPPAVAAAALCIGTVILIARRSSVGFLAAAALLILSPTLLVPITSEPAAERRMYLPLASLVVLIVAGGYACLDRLIASRAVAPSESFRSPKGLLRIGILAVSLVLACLLAFFSARRVAMFNDPVVLWQDAALHQPLDHLVQNNLGAALVDESRFAEAIDHYERALELKPDYAEAENNAGVALIALGRATEAAGCFARAIVLDNNYADAHLHLANVLAQQGDLGAAIDQYHQALKLRPNRAAWHGNLGHALSLAGNTDEAIAEFREALRQSPALAEVRFNLVSTLYAAGRFEEAIDACEAALRLQPESVEAHNYLGMALVGAGRAAEAIPHYDEAVRLDSEYADAHSNWGIALIELQRPGEAIPHFEEAVRLKSDAKLYANLASGYAAAGRPFEAMNTARKALAIARDAGQTDLAAQLEAWLSAYRERMRRP